MFVVKKFDQNLLISGVENEVLLKLVRYLEMSFPGTAQRFKSGGLKGERSEGGWGSGGLLPETFLRPRPLERRKTPLSKKDVLIFVHIKLQFLSEKRQGTIKRDTYRDNY